MSNRLVEELRSGEIAGANVTIPWKRAWPSRLADRVAPSAQRVGAANVLERSADGAIVAHNTDVPALVEEFQRLASTLRRVVVIGNGGARCAWWSSARCKMPARSASRHSRRAGFWLAEVEASWPHAAEFTAQGAVRARLAGIGSACARSVFVRCSRASM